jgi:hypothetical protein
VGPKGSGDAAERCGTGSSRERSGGAWGAVRVTADMGNGWVLTGTLEFDAAVPTAWGQTISFADDATTTVVFNLMDGGLNGEHSTTTEIRPRLIEATVFPFKLMVDGDSVKVYFNGQRIVNAPGVALGRSRRRGGGIRPHDLFVLDKARYPGVRPRREARFKSDAVSADSRFVVVPRGDRAPRRHFRRAVSPDRPAGGLHAH